MHMRSICRVDVSCDDVGVVGTVRDGEPVGIVVAYMDKMDALSHRNVHKESRGPCTEI